MGFRVHIEFQGFGGFGGFRVLGLRLHLKAWVGAGLGVEGLAPV